MPDVVSGTVKELINVWTEKQGAQGAMCQENEGIHKGRTLCRSLKDQMSIRQI